MERKNVEKLSQQDSVRNLDIKFLIEIFKFENSTSNKKFGFENFHKH